MVLEKTKLDDFDSADISMTDMNLQVVSSDDQYCYISYQASDQDKEPISYQVKDGKLRIRENDKDGKTYYHVDIGFLSGLLGEGTLTTDENVVTLYVPEGQKWKLADIKSDISNILLNGCEIENGTIQTDSGDVFFKNCDFDNLKVKTDMGDLCFIGKEDVMRTWNIQVNTDMGDINVDETTQAVDQQKPDRVNDTLAKLLDLVDILERFYQFLVGRQKSDYHQKDDTNNEILIHNFWVLRLLTVFRRCPRLP